MTDLITGPALAAATGATYRQVDYWTRTGVLEPVVDTTGSGHIRQYHRNLIAPIRTLVAVSAALRAHRATGISAQFARTVIDQHHAGGIDLGHGIRITWDPTP